MFDRAARSPSSTWAESRLERPTPSIRDALSTPGYQSGCATQDWPLFCQSIRRLTTKFLPRFGSLETIRRPTDRAAAVPIETAYMRARIRTSLHVEMYFDFMALYYARDSFLTNVVFIDFWISLSRLPCRAATGSATEKPALLL
jgi:hypothetical protein